MTRGALRATTGAACAAALLVGCASAAGSGVPRSAASAPPVGAPTATPPTATAPGPLLDELLAAREDGDPLRFAALVSQAAATCTDPAATRQLGQLSAVAERWADSLSYSRPKAQARTEAQLAEVDWAALVSAC